MEIEIELMELPIRSKLAHRLPTTDRGHIKQEDLIEVNTGSGYD